MKKTLCNNSSQRSVWAVSLCFASTVLMSLEAFHPGGCLWLGLNQDQYFALSALIATMSAFLGSFILVQTITLSREK